MEWFVFFSDGYADDGDVGLKSFVSRESAEAFIANRIQSEPGRTPDRYTVIHGTKKFVEPVEVVQSVRIR